MLDRLRSVHGVPAVGLRLAVSAASVVLVTAAIYGLREGAPVLSLGVLYLFAVLPIAVFFGLPYAIPVAAASMAAFNFLLLPPVHTFRLADGETWVALAVYVVTAVVVSGLAARARWRAAEAQQREREETLLVEFSSALLRGRRVEDELAHAGAGIATLFESGRARVELGDGWGTADGEVARALVADGRRVATLYVPASAGSRVASRPRFLSALGSLLAVALDRERLAEEALEAETLRRSDASKTAVLRTVSHDLRTPLTAIRVAADALSSTTLELSAEDRRALLETIRSETSRLQRVVGDLLDLSRLQAGAVRPDPDVWMVDELLSQALDGLSGDAERVDVVLPDDVPPVRADAVQVERVLVNLLDNALKFSPPGSPVQLAVAPGGSEVVFCVTDSGPGLDQAELERVFEPFSTGADGERRGSGLGLAIARGFAESNGGRVWAELGGDGCGATFALALPAVKTPVAVDA